MIVTDPDSIRWTTEVLGHDISDLETRVGKRLSFRDRYDTGFSFASAYKCPRRMNLPKVI